VADLIALGLVLAPSADISALKQIMHRRASARGMQAMQAQDYAQAADQLALALDYSDDFNAQVQLFRALVGSRRFDQARARLVQLEQLAPTSSVVESLRAAFYEAISTAGGAGV
jgi:thioredoxin-like negative regulator of GroEL